MDIGQETKAVQALAPDNWAAGTHNGGAIDTAGFHEALFCLNAGANGGSGTVDVHVEESAASDSGFADVTDAVFTQVTEANDNGIYAGRVRITPSRKRYLRAVAVVAVAACDVGIVCVLGDANNLPAATPEFDIHG